MNDTTAEFSAEAAARSLLSRTSTFVSKSVPVPGGGAVDLSTLDPAALINSVAHETRFAIECAAEFNARWRAALRERFEAQGVVDELDAWLATGLSNGRLLRLSVMAIKPNDWFCVHAHPNIELMQTLVGTLFTPVRKSTSYNAKAPRTCDSHTGTRCGCAATRRRFPAATRAPTCGARWIGRPAPCPRASSSSTPSGASTRASPRATAP